jgi:hypothetical protein
MVSLGQRTRPLRRFPDLLILINSWGACPPPPPPPCQADIAPLETGGSGAVDVDDRSLSSTRGVRAGSRSRGFSGCKNVPFSFQYRNWKTRQQSGRSPLCCRFGAQQSRPYANYDRNLRVQTLTPGMPGCLARSFRPASIPMRIGTTAARWGRLHKSGPATS